MASEKFKNNGVSTLDGSINNSVTSLDVASGHGSRFPTAGNFRIRIDDEFMLVTARSGDTFTVTRGIEDSTAASHTDGADVSHILTAGAHQQFFEDSILITDADSQPSPERAGRLWLPNDPNGLFGVALDGTDWQYYAPLYGPFSGVTLTDFQTYDTTDTDDHVEQRGPIVYWMNEGITPGGENIRILFDDVPAYSTWTIKAAIRVHPSVAASYSSAGVGIMNSSNSNIMEFSVGPRQDDSFLYLWYWHTNATTFNESVPNTQQRSYKNEVSWIKVTYDGTDYSMYTSPDGREWRFIASRAASLGFGAADRWGMYFNPFNADANGRYKMSCEFLHLTIEDGVV